MAEFWAYIPEPDELEFLAGPGKRRQNLLVAHYVELQAYCSRNPDQERYLFRAEALECVDGTEWVLDSLCKPLPVPRPATTGTATASRVLLHAPGGPGTQCPIEGCLHRCLDELCDCSIGMWRGGIEKFDRDNDFRLCLTR